jgi:hypothetical protein
VTTPVGLTRAEEEREQQQSPEPRARSPVAPPGAALCRASVPPGGGDCGAAATVTVVWSDADRTPMCDECAQRTQQLAQSHRAAVKVESVR